MARSATRDLTQGSPMKLLLGFALPLLAGFLFQQLYSFVDTLIVGAYLGYDKLGAVGSTGSLNFLINGFCMGICSGFSLPIAQAFGARQESEMRRFVVHAAYLCAIISVLMGLVTGILTPQLLDMLGTIDTLRGDAIAYIRPIFFAIPATVMYNMASGIMRSLGDGRTPMIAIVIAALINIVLDIVFMVSLGMGVEGAAYATVISQLVSGLWCVTVLRRKFTILRMQKDEMRWRAPFVRRLLNMGIPFGLQYSITAIGSLTVTAAMNSISVEAVSAVTAAGKLSMLFCIVFDALASAMATFAGQNVGARKLDRVDAGLKSASIIGCIYCILAFLVILFFGRSMVSLFVSTDAQADPEAAAATIETVLNMAHQFLIVNSALYIPLLFVNIVRFTIQGLGYTTVAMVAGVMELLGRAGVALLLVPAFQYNAAVWANPAAWLLADAFLFPCYFTVMKRLRNRMQRNGSSLQAPAKSVAVQ